MITNTNQHPRNSLKWLATASLLFCVGALALAKKYLELTTESNEADAANGLAAASLGLAALTALKNTTLPTTDPFCRPNQASFSVQPVIARNIPTFVFESLTLAPIKERFYNVTVNVESEPANTTIGLIPVLDSEHTNHSQKSPWEIEITSRKQLGVSRLLKQALIVTSNDPDFTLTIEQHNTCPRNVRQSFNIKVQKPQPLKIKLNDFSYPEYNIGVVGYSATMPLSTTLTVLDEEGRKITPWTSTSRHQNDNLKFDLTQEPRETTLTFILKVDTNNKVLETKKVPIIIPGYHLETAHEAQEIGWFKQAMIGIFAGSFFTGRVICNREPTIKEFTYKMMFFSAVALILSYCRDTHEANNILSSPSP